MITTSEPPISFWRSLEAGAALRSPGGFRGLRVRVWGLGFRGLRVRVWGLGVRVWGLGFAVWGIRGLGVQVYGVEGLRVTA